MSRIKGADPANLKGPVARIIEEQEKVWGVKLVPSLIYARRPSVFRANTNMRNSLNVDEHIPHSLTTLLNRRVASLNGCPA